MSRSIRSSRARPRAVGLAIVLAALACAPGHARALGTEPGSELEIRLVTVAPGHAAVSRFGHTALWVLDHEAGTSRAFGFGLSDFRRPGFLYQIVEGRVEAWGDDIDAERMLDLYRDQDRRISVQTLNLSPAQRASVRQILEREIRPENTFFNYDIFRANCTTAVRDVLDEALGGQLRAATIGVPSGRTYRSSANPYTASDPFLHTFMSLVVVNGIDRPVDQWDAMFLPDTLRDRLRELSIRDEAGDAVPLVIREEVVYEPEQPRALGSVHVLWLRYGLVGTCLGLVFALLGWTAGRHDHPGVRRLFAFTAGAWILAAGLTGVTLIALWAFTGQNLTYWNANILQANPLLLAVGATAWGSRPDRARAVRLAWVVVGIGLLGLLVQVAPPIPVPRPPLVAFLLPVHVGLAWGLSRTPESSDLAG